MTMSKLIVVVGATGTQGGSVARTFLQFPDWSVRGITRNTASDSSKALAAEGVEVVQGDLDDKESLVQAFQGATAVFANTDYFTHFFHAMSPANLPAGQSAFEYAYAREVEQGLNIAEAAETPSVLKTLDRFVMSSLSHASKLSGGKVTKLYHFDSKAETIRLTKERCPGVAARMSFVQMGHFVTNWKHFAKLAPVKQSDGRYLLGRATSETFKMPHVVAHRDTGAFVKALVDMPPGKTLLGVSEWMTFPEWAETWGRVLEVDARYEVVSNVEMYKGIPYEMAEELRIGFDYFEEFGFDGGDPDVLRPDELEFDVPRTSMEEYIRSEDWSSILNA